MLMALGAAVTMAGAGFVSFFLVRGEPRAPRIATGPTPSPAASAVPPVVSETPNADTNVPENPNVGRDAGRISVGKVGTAPPAAGRSAVSQVIESHRSAFAKCQRAERQVNPSAPRRYSLAVTLAPDGRIQWFEVLSEASPAIRSCFDSTARGLTYPKPSEGNARALVTLSFPEDP